MGFTPDENYGGSFWDKAEELPDCYIIQREIGKAVAGKPFFVNGEETGKPERFAGVSYIVFRRYYDLWDNYHYFGYPNKLDWRDAAPWFNLILKRFENTFKRVDIMLEKRAMKNSQGGDL